jgi:outer membrane protein TolC
MSGKSYNGYELKIWFARITFIFIFLFQLVFSGNMVFPQNSGQVITIENAITAALSNGYDNKLIDMSLAVARAQTALSVAKDTFSLNGNLGYGQGIAIGDTSISGGRTGSGSSSSSGGATAGLTLTGPTTSVSVTAVPYTPQSIILPYNGDPSLSIPANTTSSLSVSANQVILSGYTGGQTEASAKKSLLSLSSKELVTESNRSALILRIKQAYYTMLTAQKTLVTRKALLDKQNKVLDIITAIYGLKQATTVDLKTAQINAANASIDVEDAEHQLRTSRIRLANLMGMQSEAMFDVADTSDPEVPASDIDEAVSSGLSHRTDLRQLEYQQQSSEIDTAVARGDSFFSVSLGGTAAWTFDWSGKNTGNVTLSAKLAMPIIDAGSSASNTEAASVQTSIYSMQKEQLARSITADIRDAYETMQIQAKRLEIAGMNALNVENQLELMNVAVLNKTATNQDLLTSASNAANAEAAFAKARSDYQLAVLQLQSVMGL